MCKSLYKLSNETGRKGEHDGLVVLYGDVSESLQVSELYGGWEVSHHIGRHIEGPAGAVLALRCHHLCTC